MRSGMYGMYGIAGERAPMGGTAPAQIPHTKISVCHGVGGMFAASGGAIMSNEPPERAVRRAAGLELITRGKPI
jgi:hypothetical protein